MWRNIPFSKFPKTPLQQVLDLVLDASALARRADQLLKLPPEEQISLAVKLIEEGISLDGAMQEFYLGLEEYFGGLVYWINDSNSEALDDYGAVSYVFPNYHTGTTMMLFWATTTVMWSGICQLYCLLGSLTTLVPTVDGKLTGQFCDDGDKQEFILQHFSRFSDFRTMACNVCRSVEFCMQEELGMSSMSCPLSMIIKGLECWPGFESEISWAKSKLERIYRNGMRIVKFVK
jgi:hypothetical protein